MIDPATGGRYPALCEQDPSNLSVLLDRVKGEVDSLVVMLGDMQTGLTPLLSDKAVDDPSSFKLAQSLDLAWQILGSLSIVLRAVGEDGLAHHPIDIDGMVKDLPLANLAARLRGKPVLVSGCDDLDLF